MRLSFTRFTTCTRTMRGGRFGSAPAGPGTALSGNRPTLTSGPFVARA